MSRTNRRQFILHSSKVLCGLAFVRATPSWAFSNRSNATDLVQRSIRTMGTDVHISMPFRDFSADRVESGIEVLYDVDRCLSTHQATSQLSRMNESPGAWYADSYLTDVATAAIELGEATEGALDVTILPALRQYGFIPGKRADHDRIDFTQLQVAAGKTRIKNEGYQADFGGIAKGYAVDQAIGSMHLKSSEAALIDAGGDIFAKGRPQVDRLWKIGIQHPFRDSTLLATIEIENEAVATSGTYVNKRTVKGVEVSHLIDPRNGKSVDHVVSATIVAPNAMLADALATATSVMESKAGQALISSMPQVEGFWLYKDGSTFMTNGLKKRLTVF